MNATILDQLHREEDISATSFAKIKLKQEQKLVSVHLEIKTLLYLGVLLLSTGLAILIYQNIDTIGHQAILLFVACICTGCFLYCNKNKLPFSRVKVFAPNSFFDYILLLACCTFITFIAYLQYQYNIFGNRYGLAVFFPMILLFFCAYYFDHLGILTMAIVNLATWLGFTITPMKILAANNFNYPIIIFTGLGLGMILLLLARESNRQNFKKHFEFTYANFGTHVVFISSIAAIIHFDAIYLLLFFIFTGMVYFFSRKALQEKSFYFMLIITLYFYFGISYIVINLLSLMSNFDMAIVYLVFLYFILSGTGLVLFLMKINKKFKTS